MAHQRRQAYRRSVSQGHASADDLYLLAARRTRLAMCAMLAIAIILGGAPHAEAADPGKGPSSSASGSAAGAAGLPGSERAARAGFAAEALRILCFGCRQNGV